jgi:hypothetical protein
MRAIVKDPKGVVRFQANPIVVRLFDEAIKNGFGLQQLMLICPHFSAQDWEEFLQLIGWPVSSYCAVNLTSSRGASSALAAAHYIFPDSI